ncbi:hypothetical protein CASFOL_034035 [Castilleja foliolosa]|uniref:Uncharacterized protein n=1 Tax=Castilleja foliolosa TaxID=1961234 RepID=A0ABD3BZH7_9LAMI
MAADSNSKKTSRGGWKSAIFIIFVEVAERFAYYGVAGNLFMYLTKVLGQPTATAAKNVNTWQGVSAIFPVVGGFLADSYLGRFKTILASSITYLIVLQWIYGTISNDLLHTIIKPDSTAAQAWNALANIFQDNKTSRAVYLEHSFANTKLDNFANVSSYSQALKSLSDQLSNVGAPISNERLVLQLISGLNEQFDGVAMLLQQTTPLPEFYEKTAKSSFFNWWYVGIVCGATAALLVVIYVQEFVGWSLGFGMLAVAVAVALVVFLVGSGGYRRQAPVGSPFTRVAQVVVAATKKRRLSEAVGRGVCEDEDDSGVQQALAPTGRFRFLDKATIIDEKDIMIEKRDPWRLCSVTQVEEAKLVFQLIPIWFSCLMFAIVIAQLGTYFTKQGTTMNRSITPRFQIPAASFQVITGLTVLISVLLYERALVPFAKRLTGRPSGITILQRIGIGLAMSVLTMAVAAFVESRRVRFARENRLLDQPRSVVSMPVWWLVPQYMLMGVSDVFTVVGLQELFYDQMPVGMRSIGAAAYITVTGVGSFLSTCLIMIVQGISGRVGFEWLGDNINRARVDCFYWVLAGMSVVNLCGYVCVARRFVYKRSEVDLVNKF